MRIWEIESGTELAALDGHSGSVVRACFSPDGLTLATCGQLAADRFEILLWSAGADTIANKMKNPRLGFRV